MLPVGRFFLRFYFSILCMLAIPYGFSQEDPSWFIKRWTAEDGLPQNSVVDVLPSRSGFLYLATEGGLVRFDGANFKVFNLDNVPIFKSNRIKALAETPDTSLWILNTSSQLIRYKNHKFTEIKSFDIAEFPNDIPKIWLDHEDNVLVSTQHNKLFIISKNTNYRKADWVPTVVFNKKEVIISILPLQNKKESILLTGIGMYRFRNRVILKDTLLTNNYLLAKEIPLEMTFGPDGNLWILNVDNMVTSKGGKIVQFPCPRVTYPFKFFIDPTNTVWLPTKGGFAWLTPFSNSLREHTINVLSTSVSIVQDRESNIWLGTAAEGLVRITANPFTYLPRIANTPRNTASVLYNPKDSCFYVAPSTSGVQKIKNKKIISTYLYDAKAVTAPVTALALDSVGHLYMGSWGEGVYKKLVGKNNIAVTLLKHKKPHILSEFQLVSLYAHNKYGMLIGSASGPKNIINDTIYKSLWYRLFKNDPINAFYQEPNGHLWFTSKKGTGWLLPTGKVAWLYPNIKHEEISHRGIYVGQDSTIYLGTDGWGFGIFAHGELTYLGTKNGLPNGVISYVYDNGGNYLLLTSNIGLIKIPKSEINLFIKNKSYIIDCALFNASDGLRNSEFNGGFTPAGQVLPNNKLLLPTLDGAVIVDANLLIKNLTPPKAVVEAFIDGPQRINNPLQIETPYKGQRIEFHYTAPSLSQAKNIRFKYRLVGYDKEWVLAGASRIASYPQIPPGNYVFELAVQNKAYGWNLTSVRMPVLIIPPFYMTLWFKAFIFLLFCALLYIAYTFRAKRQEIKLENQQALMNVLPDLMLRLNEAGRYIEYVAGDESDLITPFSEMFGKTPEEIIPQLAPKLRSCMELAKTSGLVQKISYTLLVANGRRQIYELRLISIKNGFEYLLIIRNITQKARTELKLKKNQSELRQALNEKTALLGQIAQKENERLSAFLDAQETERQRIAQDLHDSLGQLASTAKMQIQTFFGNGSLPQSEKVSQVTNLLDTLTQELRSISFDLKPASLQHFGLLASIKDLLESVEKNNGIEVIFYTNTDLAGLSEKATIYLYRIVQESIANILKHAQATIIEVQIIEHPNMHYLEITDNGIGMDVAKSLQNTKSSGLKNLRLRSSVLQGDFDIESGSNGTSLYFRISREGLYI